MHKFMLELMCVCSLLTLITFIIPSQSEAESGSFSDCLIGCIPGDNECTNCCKKSFESKFPTTCYDIYIERTQVCESLSGTRSVACFKNSQNDLKACHDEYDLDIKEFVCPDWMTPKECPFECQVWSPASRKCVGAPQEVCD